MEGVMQRVTLDRSKKQNKISAFDYMEHATIVLEWRECNFASVKSHDFIFSIFFSRDIKALPNACTFLGFF